MLTTRQQQGFNLIEMMAVLAVAAILIGIGLPSLKSTIDRKAVSAEATRFARSINFARSQAVNQQQVVTMARKSTAANDWSQGWTIYVDAGEQGNQAFNAADGDILLRDINITNQNIDILTNSPGDNWITVMPSGRLGESSAVAVLICDKDRSQAFEGSRVDVSLVGRTRFSAIAGADKDNDCTF